MNNKINKSLLIVIVAVLCLIISGCSGGGTYVGEYVDGLKHGQGTYTYADGRQYVGEFKDGVFHGQGTMTYANGDQEEGIWGAGEFLYENKDK